MTAGKWKHTWNYRWIKRVVDGETIFSLEEVFYNEQGEPWLHTEDQNHWCYDEGEISWFVERVKAASEKPILSESDFRKE